jgi:two-component system LytT family sensor kinase
MSYPEARSSGLPGVWIALIWLCMGLVSGTQIVVGMRAVGMHHNWAALFFVNAVSWFVWACATPLVLTLGRRFPLTRALDRRFWPIHLGACLVIAIADACWNSGLSHVLNPLAVAGPRPSWRHLAIIDLYQRFDVGLIAYAAILAAGHTMAFLKRLAMREAEAARLTAELSRAQLDALRRQMEPHFLFNTLNGIAGLVREHKNGPAVEMIAGLSDLLRRVLEGADRQLVPLAEELSFLERYIELQQMRFQDRLNVIVDVPLELYGALVPGLILQPLVENAILHGVGQRVEGGSIRVGAARNEGILTLSIHNDGPVLPASGVESNSGVGISNTRGRLVTLYGSRCALEVRNHVVAGVADGVETVVRVPYQLEP